MSRRPMYRSSSRPGHSMFGTPPTVAPPLKCSMRCCSVVKFGQMGSPSLFGSPFFAKFVQYVAIINDCKPIAHRVFRHSTAILNSGQSWRLRETYPRPGNCTLGPVYVTVCPKCGYDTTLSGWPEMGREAEALRELVASWHCLTPSVRAAIIDLLRSG